MSSGKWPPFCLGLNVLIAKIFASRFQALIGGCLVNAVGYPQRPFPIGRASIWSVQWDVCSQNGGSLPRQLCDNYTGTSCVREWGVRSSGKWWPTFMRWTSDVFALINPYFKCLILWYICQHSCLKSRFLFQCLILWYICQHSCIFNSFSWLNIIFIILDVLMFTKHVPGPWVGAHLGPTGPRWDPCWPHELCYLGLAEQQLKNTNIPWYFHWFIERYQGRPKQPSFWWQHYQMCFLSEWKWLYISVMFVPNGAIDSLSATVQVMTWHCTGDKPITEPIKPLHWCLFSAANLALAGFPPTLSVKACFLATKTCLTYALVMQQPFSIPNWNLDTCIFVAWVISVFHHSPFTYSGSEHR